MGFLHCSIQPKDVVLFMLVELIKLNIRVVVRSTPRGAIAPNPGQSPTEHALVMFTRILTLTSSSHYEKKAALNRFGKGNIM
jgi:hypothetical protein